MSYFKVIPELRDDLNLTKCEWLVFCLLLSYPQVTMSTKKIGDIVGYSKTNVKDALRRLQALNLINIESNKDNSSYKIKEVINPRQYDYYLGKSL